ncbi:MAG: Do family serine endopeptidase [Elusimicrobia bacterium]|nr:Do family serine endopeptidase [Elusimicrobiota bacterium]
MKNKIIFSFGFVIGSILLIHSRSHAADTGLPGLQQAFRAVAEKARPSCVNISASHEEEIAVPEFYFMDPEEFFFDYFHGAPQRRGKPRTQKRTQASTGSGVIIDPEGYVLTNAHVVADADKIKVRLTVNGKKKNYPAKVVGRDERVDLALIKIEGQGPFPAAALGDSDQAQVGDWAIAVGSPFELEQTFTVGVISAMRQSFNIEGRTYHNLIQTDAAINRGNSGGPLVNINGEVIGINTAIYSPSGVFAGIGFALPVNLAKDVIPYLKSGKQRQWGWIGVTVAEIDEVLAKRFNLPESRGALINEIITDGPAEKAGLERSDVIVSVNDTAIDTPDDLTSTIRQRRIGDTLRLGIIRDGRAKDLKVTVGQRPKWADVQGQDSSDAAPENDSAEPPATVNTDVSWTWEGLDLSNVNAAPRAFLKRWLIPPQTSGVAIIAINPASSLASYLDQGDVVTGINRSKIDSVNEFQREVRRASLKDGIVFDIIRQGNRQFVSIQVSP